MTVLLVLITVAAFLLADFIVQKTRSARGLAAALDAVARPLRLPHGVALASNHTWLRQDREGVTTIGIDEFLSRLVGAVEDIIVSPAGTALSPAMESVQLRDGTRMLRLAAPLQGRVVEVNPELRRNPGIAVSDPYGSGWLFRVKSADGSRTPAGMPSGERAAEWLRAQFAAIRDFLADRAIGEAAGMVQDGGLPVEGVLKSCDAQTWEEFQAAFVTLRKQNG